MPSITCDLCDGDTEEACTRQEEHSAVPGYSHSESHGHMFVAFKWKMHFCSEYTVCDLGVLRCRFPRLGSLGPE